MQRRRLASVMKAAPLPSSSLTTFPPIRILATCLVLHRLGAQKSAICLALRPTPNAGK